VVFTAKIEMPSVTIHPNTLSDIYKRNMIIAKNCDDIADQAKRAIVRKIKGIHEWETPSDPVCKTYVDIQKHLLKTVIEIQEKIDSITSSP
jgi:hypothetical protein